MLRMAYTLYLSAVSQLLYSTVGAHEPFCDNGGSFSHILDKCKCHHTFYGDACQFSCNHGTPRYKSRGWWFGEEWFVRCECFPGWMGADCTLGEGSFSHTEMPEYVTLPPNPYRPEPIVQPPLQTSSQNQLRIGAIERYHDMPHPGWKVGVILGVIAFALVLLIIGIVIGVVWKRRRGSQRQRTADKATSDTNVNISVLTERIKGGNLEIPPPSYPASSYGYAASSAYPASETSLTTKNRDEFA